MFIPFCVVRFFYNKHHKDYNSEFSGVFVLLYILAGLPYFSPMTVLACSICSRWVIWFKKSQLLLGMRSRRKYLRQILLICIVCFLYSSIWVRCFLFGLLSLRWYFLNVIFWILHTLRGMMKEPEKFWLVFLEQLMQIVVVKVLINPLGPIKEANKQKSQKLESKLEDDNGLPWYKKWYKWYKKTSHQDDISRTTLFAIICSWPAIL